MISLYAGGSGGSGGAFGACLLGTGGAVLVTGTMWPEW